MDNYNFDVGTSQNVSYVLTTDEFQICSYDPLTKQQSTQWMFLRKRKCSQKLFTVGALIKKIIAVFFRRSGPVALIPLECHRTVPSRQTSQYYCIGKFVYLKLSGNRIASAQVAASVAFFFLQDIAPARTAGRPINYLTNLGVMFTRICQKLFEGWGTILRTAQLTPYNFNFIFQNIGGCFFTSCKICLVNVLKTGSPKSISTQGLEGNILKTVNKLFSYSNYTNYTNLAK